MINDNVRRHLRYLMSLPPEAEDEVRGYCAAALVGAGFKVEEQEEVPNLLARRDGRNILCLNAHLDSHPKGIGADDRCGLAAILAAVEETVSPVAVLLTTGEEQGGIGAQAVPEGWWQDIGLCASFDRRGSEDIITHYSGMQLAPDGILDRVLLLARSCGMGANLTRSVVWADAFTFAEAGVPCVNIACGFYHEHCVFEYYIPYDVVVAADVATELIIEGWCYGEAGIWKMMKEKKNDD